MRTFLDKFRLLAVAGGVICSGMLLAQPYVTIPTGCTVLTPGQGSPPAGTVGRYGRIIMPEPFAGGNFIITTPAGSTVLDWSMLGDLSRATSNNPPTAPIQFVAGNNATVSIMSYNKNLRQGFEASNPFIARSKGRITIRYTTSNGCNDFIEFDVLKKWLNPNPPIVGPDCWEPGGVYVYAVDIAHGDNVLDAIGFDKYYWQVRNNAGTLVGSFANNSAESSSIVYTAPVGAAFNPPFEIKCCFGEANIGSAVASPFPGAPYLTATQCVTKAILSTPQTPTFSTPIPSCLTTTATTFSAAITPVAGYTYTWSCTNTVWTLTPSGAQGQNLTVTTMDGNPGTITLTITNGTCTPATFTYTVNRTFTSAQLTTSSTCVNIGASFTASVSGATGNQTCWTLPAGWTFVNNNAAQSNRTITVPAGTCAGAYTVTAWSCACPGTTSSVTVNVRPPTPATPAGPACINIGATAPLTYTVPAVACATGYQWTIPSGWTGSSTTNSITVTPNGSSVGNISVIALGAPGCPSLTSPNLVVRFNPTMPVVTQPLCLPAGPPPSGQPIVPASVNFAVGNAQSGSTYTWTFDAGFSPSGGTSGTSVSRNVTAVPGTYTCTVTNTNLCGTQTFSFQVTVPQPAIYLQNNVSFSVISADPISGASYSLWNCTTNAFVAGPQASNAFSLNNPGAGNYRIRITLPAASGSCQLWTSCIATAHNAMAPESDGQEMFDGTVKISPNPNSGAFVILLENEIKEGSAVLMDATGRVVKGTTRIVRGTNEFDAHELASGQYFLRLNLDGRVALRPIIITRQ